MLKQNSQKPNKQKINKCSAIRGWMLVFACALFGCTISAAFPQFSLTVTSLSAVSGIPMDVLLISDTVKSIGVILAMFASGFAYKRFGIMPLFLYSVVATIVPQFFIPHTQQILVLMIWKIIQGTSSLIFPVFLVIIMDCVAERDRGLASAVFNGIFYAGGGIGGSLAGFVTARSGWVASYSVLAAVMAAAGVLWYLIYRFTAATKTASIAPNEPNSKTAAAQESGERIRAAAGMGERVRASVNSVNTEERRQMSANMSERIRTSVNTSVVALPAKQANKAGRYSANAGAGTLRITLISICLFAATFALQAITADMPVFAGAMGHGPLATAKLSAWVTVAMIAGCVVAGRVSDLSARRAKHAGIARLWSMLPAYLIIIAIIPIFAFGDMERLPLLCAAGAVLTLGAAWGLGAFYSIIPELFPADKVPTATGIVGGVGDIGMPVAPMVVGVLFGIQGRWDLGWGACAVFSVISAAVLFVLIGYVRRENRSVARHPRYRSSDSLFSPDMP